MARQLNPGSGQASKRGELTFEDLPRRLRPSAFLDWLAEVPATPDHGDADHVAAAYLMDLEEIPELVAYHAPRPIPADGHWRSQIAAQRQWEAYHEWCQDHRLVVPGVNPRSSAAVPRAWSWSALTAWEAQR